VEKVLETGEPHQLYPGYSRIRPFYVVLSVLEVYFLKVNVMRKRMDIMRRLMLVACFLLVTAFLPG
jgi:hypothetical protein